MSWSNKRVLQWLLDVNMQQFIGAFYEAQVVGRTLLGLTLTRIKELGMNIDDRHVEALLFLRDALVDADTADRLRAHTVGWTYADAKEVFMHCAFNDRLSRAANVIIQRRSTRVKCFEICILVCTTLSTTISVSAFSELDETAAFALKIAFTALALIATLFSGALNLLGWQQQLRDAEQLTRVLLEISIASYDAVDLQHKSSSEFRKERESLDRKMNDLVGTLQLDSWGIPEMKGDDEFTDDQLDKLFGGLLYRRFPPEMRTPH